MPLLTDLFTYKMLPNCKTLILHDSSLSRVSVAELLALLSYLDVLDVSNTTLALWTRSWNVRKALVEQNMLHKYIWVNGPAALVTLRWVDAVPKGRRGVVRAHIWRTFRRCASRG